MPKRIHLTEEDIEWLESAYDSGVSFQDMANEIGCHVDTMKRQLMKFGIADFPGAKYQPKRGHDVEMWTRPCSVCGDTKPRPKMQFRCDSCHENEEKYDCLSLPDEFLTEW